MLGDLVKRVTTVQIHWQFEVQSRVMFKKASLFRPKNVLVECAPSMLSQSVNSWFIYFCHELDPSQRLADFAVLTQQALT